MIHRFFSLLALLCLCLTGCNQETEVVTYRLMYPSEPEQPEPRPAEMPESMPSGMSGQLPDDHPPIDMADSSLPNMPTPSGSPAYVWETPEHWVPQAGSNMRIASFQVPGPEGSGVGDCSIIRLGGMAGGIASNINRWRGQIGLSPQDEATIMQELERLPVALGEQALLVTMTGDSEAIAAAIIPHGGSSLFVKLRGPQATVGANEGAFRQLVTSIDTTANADESP